MTPSLRPVIAAVLLAIPAGAHSLAQGFQAVLSGANAAPPNASVATGIALVVFDATLHTMAVDVTFSGLQGTATAAHIHGPTATAGTGTAGAATTTPTFPGFPIANSGAYSQVFDMTLASSYNPSFVTGNGNSIPAAEAALIQAAIDGKAYLNIHSTVFGGGEISGFLTPVPESSTIAALAFMAAGTGLQIWRRRGLKIRTGNR